MYKIEKIDKSEWEFPDDKDLEKYKIIFQFENNNAEVWINVKLPSVELFPRSNEGQKMFYISSQTDGYHWLDFLLSQALGANHVVGEPWNADRNEQKLKVQTLWKSFNFDYLGEDKETCYLLSNTDLEESNILIEKIASIIEPRFALAEKIISSED